VAGRAIQVLKACGVEPKAIKTVNAGRCRNSPRHQGIQQLAHHPQLYIKGEFIGGSDIMMEMYESVNCKSHQRLIDLESGYD
jgi:monothiol glutaredoxin